ncbi:MAG: hypothetical protein Q7U76_12940 [Nitrospirota bacterium]|nr:hypothetical protein [Nitrospirota bacterium]
MRCACGNEMKAGLRSTVLVQKAKGMVLCDADRDQVKSGDTYVCLVCIDRGNHSAPGAHS